MTFRFGRSAISAAALLAAGAAQAQPGHHRAHAPGPASSAGGVDARAARLVDAMSLEEQISLLRPLPAVTLASLGVPLPPQVPAWLRQPMPPGAIGSAAFVPGLPKLGWPALQESDAGLGVANMGGIARKGDEATAMPSSLALAASFDPDLARRSGEAIGEEAHAKGFNVQLAGGVDLARDPRNGRNFEYAGEDPLLAGRIAGASIAGIQSRHVVSTVKHYALNDEETGRTVLDAQIGEAALRESDLLAFQIAIETGHPGAVMCAYNKVNGTYACENPFLLSRVLKEEWRYPGWVMSDWGANHSLGAAVRAGLDQESPQGGDTEWFAGLADAVAKGEVPRRKVRDMAFRIVRSVIAVGALDDPSRPGGAIDKAAHAALAQQSAEAGMVLLKNEGLLPLGHGVRRVALIGGHADKWVPLGGGSSQVAPYGGLQHETSGSWLTALLLPGYVPSSPMKALQALRPDLEITYDDGKDPARAAAAAAKADVAIVFAEKIQSEALDAADLSLPGGQDGLIARVAAANRKTAVVLETGNPVEMPWLSSVAVVLEAWYPGQRGGEAIAAILTGATAPSGRLPMTFPQEVAQLPRPKLDGYDPKGPHGPLDPPPPPFAVAYREGGDVGYRWFEKSQAGPLFPFGYGLTYTTFRYDDLRVKGDGGLKATFRLRNTGRRAGVEVAQLYVAPPGRTHRLAGWSRVRLKPGEARLVTIAADPRILASYDEAAGAWRRAAGAYDLVVSQAAGRPGLHGTAVLTAAQGQGF